MVGEVLKMSLLSTSLNVLHVKTAKIGQRTVERIEYFTKCPDCEKEISASTQKRVEYLLESHRLQVHGKVGSKA